MGQAQSSIIKSWPRAVQPTVRLGVGAVGLLTFLPPGETASPMRTQLSPAPPGGAFVCVLCGGAIKNEQPTLVGGRVPLEAEYREFWEFPYPEDLKIGLMIALLQARTVLAWLRSFEVAGVPLEQVEIVPRADADAALTAIGGVRAPDILARAREVELAIYRISAALMPPEISEIDDQAAAAYRPFDVIKSFRIVEGDTVSVLRPLVIFDDAQVLSMSEAGFAPTDSYNVIDRLSKVSARLPDRAAEVLAALVKNPRFDRRVYMAQSPDIRTILENGRTKGSPATGLFVTETINYLAAMGDSSYLDLLPRP